MLKFHLPELFEMTNGLCQAVSYGCARCNIRKPKSTMRSSDGCLGGWNLSILRRPFPSRACDKWRGEKVRKVVGYLSSKQVCWVAVVDFVRVLDS